MSKQRGFSLLELMIVVAIILIIAALAVPSLSRARMAANEASAASALKTIGTANVVYSSLFNLGYAGELAHLGPPRDGGKGKGACATVSSECADLLDSLLSGVEPNTKTPVKSGYQFTYYAAEDDPTPASPNGTYAVVATPVSPGSSGVSTFCFDYSNIIWKDTSGAQTTANPSGCAATWPIGGNISPN